PDGKLCISGGADGKFRVWDLEKKNLVNTIDGHGGKIISLSLSRGGDTMASLTSGHMIRVWELPTFEISKEINGDTDRISAITISPDGRQILAGSENGGVTIVNLDDARKSVRHIVDANCVSVAYSASGSQFAWSDYQSSILVYEPGNTKAPHRAARVASPITTMSFFPRGDGLMTGSKDGTVCLCDLIPDAIVPRFMFSEHEDAVTGIAIFDDGRLAVSASQDGTLRVWNSVRDQASRVRPGGPNISRAVFSPDGLLILSASWDGQVNLYDAAKMKLILNIGEHSGVVFDAAFSPDGRQAVSGGMDGTVRLWDIIQGKGLRHFQVTTNAIRRVTFSPDGRLVIAGEGPMPEGGGVALLGNDPRLFKLHVT